MFDIYGNIKNLSVDAKKQAVITYVQPTKVNGRIRAQRQSGDIYVKIGSCGQAAGIAGKFQEGYTLCRL